MKLRRSRLGATGWAGLRRVVVLYNCAVSACTPCTRIQHATRCSAQGQPYWRSDPMTPGTSVDLITLLGFLAYSLQQPRVHHLPRARVARTPGVAALCPQIQQAAERFGRLLTQLVARACLDTVHNWLAASVFWKLSKQVDTITLHDQVQHLGAVAIDHMRHPFRQSLTISPSRTGRRNLGHSTKWSLILYTARGVPLICARDICHTYEE